MFEVKVIVELGEKTLTALSGVIANSAKIKEPPSVEDAKPESPKTGSKKNTRRTKEQIAAEKAQTLNGWDGIDDEAKLEAIKSEVTKHVKKGKSSDIKALLSIFDADRVSELNPMDYDAFFDTIIRYGEDEDKSE